MANTTAKGKFNVVDERGNVQTIYLKTTGDQVLVDRSSNASVIPNDVANLQHIVNKMGSLALKSKVETSDFTTGTMISSLEDLKSNTDTGKIADATVVKDIESRVDTLENSNLVTVDELDAGLATKPDTEINDTVTSTSLTWSSKKLSDQLTTLNSNTQLLNNRVNSIMSLPDGSTTNDARLEDICNAYDNTTYDSPGDAVRSQVCDLHDDIIELSNYLNDKFGDIKTKSVQINFGTYINGLASGNVGSTITYGTQSYWYRYIIDAKSFTNYKIRYYALNNQNVSDYIIVIDNNNTILAKYGTAHVTNEYAIETFTTPANTYKIIINNGSGSSTAIPIGRYIAPINIQDQINNTDIEITEKISIPLDELIEIDSGTGIVKDDGFGNISITTNSNWNWKKYAVNRGVYFISTKTASNISLDFVYAYITDTNHEIKSYYITPTISTKLIEDYCIGVTEYGYVYIQTYNTESSSYIKCKNSVYMLDTLINKINNINTFEKTVVAGYSIPKFISNGNNNLTVKISSDIFVFEKYNSQSFKRVTPSQNTFNLNNNQLLVWNVLIDDIEVVNQSTFFNNTTSYVLLLWAYFGDIRGQWYQYYLYQQLTDGSHTPMQEITTKYISRQGNFYMDNIHENTLDSIKYAKSHGFNNIRLSVCFTSDGYGVLSHSDELSSLEGVERIDGIQIVNEKISEMTISELDTNYKYYGETFSKLDNAILLCKQINMELSLEVKSGFNNSQQKYINILRAYGMNKYTVWSCSSIAQINTIINIDEHANIAYIAHLTSTSVVNELDAINTKGNKRLDIYSSDTYDATIWAYARQKNITIKIGSVYTVNDAVSLAPYCDYLECAGIEFPALKIYKSTN